jgi:hypothetical protein
MKQKRSEIAHMETGFRLKWSKGFKGGQFLNRQQYQTTEYYHAAEKPAGEWIALFSKKFLHSVPSDLPQEVEKNAQIFSLGV